MKDFKQFKEQMVPPTSQVVRGLNPFDLRSTKEKMDALKKRAELWKKHNLYNNP